MTIAIFGNAMKSRTLQEVQHILQFMTDKGVNVLLSQELRQELNLRGYPGFPENWDGEKQPENVYGEPIDFALSVGGDGTFLTSAAAIGNKNIPILGVNCGHLGFLAEVQTQDLDDILKQLVDGQYAIEQRRLLSLTVLDKDGIVRDDLIMSPNALNEIAILKQGLTNMLSIETKVNGEPVTFTLRRYLTGNDSETYAQVKDLKAGDVIDLEAFLYWYNAPQARIINAVKVESDAK